MYERHAAVVKYSFIEVPENLWNLESDFQETVSAKDWDYRESTDCCKVLSEEERPVVEIHQKTAEEMSFPHYQYKKKNGFEESQVNERQEGPRWTNRTIGLRKYK